MRRFLIALVAAGVLASTGPDLMAHSLFKKIMGKAYPVMSISCNACHVKDEKKSVRNEFGELFYKELKADKVTEAWKEAKANGRPAQKEYEAKTMTPLFEAALKKVKAETVPEVEGVENPDAGKTYNEMILEEKIDGIKVDQKKKEKLEKEAMEKEAMDNGSMKKDGEGGKTE